MEDRSHVHPKMSPGQLGADVANERARTEQQANDMFKSGQDRAREQQRDNPTGRFADRGAAGSKE
jgi:hypothetical protein